MPLLFVRLIGGCIGFVSTHLILAQTIFANTGGETAIANAMWFWLGGWMVVLFYYVLGVTVGFWGVVPLVNGIGRLIHNVLCLIKHE